LRGAGLILITHEHMDHEGGLIALGDTAALAAARLNPAQVSGNRWSEMLPWPQGPRPRPAITGTAPVAVAPGVVVIPAHSHTPGSQMIFVRLASGHEFLFAGDISTFTQNWTETRARSRLVGDYLAPEERGEVFAWLRTIQALKAQNPALVVLPGHDFEWVIDPQNLTGVRQGFTSPSV
jgi:glyoxylase-like metal-dependent hydrolase (beta-lactamase superfamily II)